MVLPPDVHEYFRHNESRKHSLTVNPCVAAPGPWVWRDIISSEMLVALARMGGGGVVIHGGHSVGKTKYLYFLISFFAKGVGVEFYAFPKINKISFERKKTFFSSKMDPSFLL